VGARRGSLCRCSAPQELSKPPRTPDDRRQRAKLPRQRCEPRPNGAGSAAGPRAATRYAEQTRIKNAPERGGTTQSQHLVRTVPAYNGEADDTPQVPSVQDCFLPPGGTLRRSSPKNDVASPHALPNRRRAAPRESEGVAGLFAATGHSMHGPLRWDRNVVG
jgi:hypothetical protein